MKCPRCGEDNQRLLSLSQTDNKTMVCDPCGTAEALEGHYEGKLTPQSEWPVDV